MVSKQSCNKCTRIDAQNLHKQEAEVEKEEVEEEGGRRGESSRGSTGDKGQMALLYYAAQTGSLSTRALTQ